MAHTAKQFAETTLTGGTDTIFTVPASTTRVIQHLSIANTDGSNPQTVEVLAGASGTTRWAKSAIAADDRFEFNGNFVMEASDILKMIGTTDHDVFVTGYDIT